MWKRILGVCLAVLLTTGLASACKPDSAESKSGNTADLDFDGEEIILAYPWTLSSPESSPGAQRRYDRIQELNKKFDVKIVEKSISSSYYNTNMVTTIMAGKPMGHLMIGHDEFIADYQHAGVYATLDDAMKKTGIDFKDKAIYNQLVRQLCNLNGKQIGFYAGVVPLKDLWFVNLRMMKDASIDIYATVDKGEWTWDKAEEYGRRLTKDNGSGTPDVYGIGASGAMGLMSSMASSNGGTFVSLNEQNKATLSLNDPNVLAALNRVYKWCVTDNICKPASATQTWTQAAADFANGQYAMLQGPVDYLSNFQSAGMKDDFGVIPPPKGPSHTSSWYTTGSSGNYFFFIPVTYQKRTAELLQLYNALSAYPKGFTMQSDWEDNHIDRVRDQKSMDYLLKLGFGGHMTLNMTAALGVSWGDPSMAMVMEKISKNETTPGAAVQEYGAQLQAQIDDKWKDIALTGFDK